MDFPPGLFTQYPTLEHLAEGAPTTLNLTAPEDLDAVILLAEKLEIGFPDHEILSAIEAHGEDAAIPLGLAVAAKLALSKSLVTHLKRPVFVSVIFAVYKEHQRILKREEHPHGEDFLRRKFRQMKWLCESSAMIKWEMIIVDDGCPEGSGEIAEKIIAEEGMGDRLRVRYLEKAIAEGLPGAGDLKSASESQKGGGILYGMWDALQTEHPDEEHIVLFTDADLSTHLGQIGLLLDPLEKNQIAAAIGSRREKSSVVVKAGTRNTRGKLFIYLWKRLVSVLPNVIDTQCAFKAFPAEVARQIIAPAIEKKFAFDIELLIKAALLDSGSITTVPVAWIDSEAASTTTDLEPYLSMLQSIVKMYRAYLPQSADAEPFARFIESLDEERWNTCINNVPAAIADCEPFQLGSEMLVSAEQLEAAIQQG
jgi:hypothetical protein